MPSANMELGMEKLKSLNLSGAQKLKIVALIRKERALREKDWEELNKILTEEQKQKMAKWRSGGKEATDSTGNRKNSNHE